MSNQKDATKIPVRINGEERIIPAGLNVRKLVVHLGLDPERVAVELDRRLVRKPEWDATRVEANASLEIVTFVGGG